MSKVGTYCALVGVNFIYACEAIFTKLAALQEPLSLAYFFCLGGAFSVMAIYAVLWQQILKRMPVGDAYMFKGTSLIFVLLFSALLFHEGITWTNIAGACMIIGGIAAYAKVE